ncbi:phosphodiester glycosidase family protein [Streptomyces sp. NBC_00249]|uniref:phosphodiester glycosidase family protein n=1 Tax=Streptomyces sp. NBC_00249 TaxID=2975690 RepID=UPI00224CF204|nr:phosphodiester glycosidase family protein [Streptomyces sp. NBC_00249]MCX5197109.1 phosphodiester glycosidase family protein [Streptomyces sp. NBC_00249]
MQTLRPLLPALLTALLAAPASSSGPAAGTASASAPAPAAGPAAATAGQAAVPASTAAAAASVSASGDEDGIETARTTRQIAPGVRLESYERLEEDRWLRVDELVADLGAGGGVRAEYLAGPAAATVAAAAAAHPAGPGRRVLAAVNGDFFDIRATGAPLGPGIGAGRLLHSASRGPGGTAVGFGPDGAGRLVRLGLAGSVTLPGGAVHALTGYNAARPPDSGLAAYTADWSGAELPALGPGPAVELRDGIVTDTAAPQRRPAPGRVLLVPRGSAQTAALAALRPGDRVTVTARPLPASGPAPVTAVGGREPLVTAGTPVNHDGKPNNVSAPRTAVGLSRDGRRLRLLTVDGRQRDSGGLTLTRLGALMHRLGSYEALNLDGGGSSTLLVARAGAKGLTVENAPSDGQLRPVPNGLVLTGPAGSGRLTGFRVEPLGDAGRVFPGLTRTLTATGQDEALGPAPGIPRWSAAGGRIGSDGVFRATGPGPGTASVEARRGAARGTLRLEVLGPPARLRPVPDGIGLAADGESARFTLTGHDARGAAAPVEPRDVTLSYDHDHWRVTEDGRGGFTVTALVPRATGRLTATLRTGAAAATAPVPGAPAPAAVPAPATAPPPVRAPAPAAPAPTAELALGVGTVDRPLTGFDDAADGTGGGAAPAEGRTGTGTALEAGPQAASATPPRPLPVPQLARSRSLWVRGDGSGTRPTVEPADADGAALTVRGLWRLAVGAGPADGAELLLTGAEREPFTRRGVRFLPLDTARPTLDGGAGRDRMRALRQALEAAAREPGTGALAVVQRYAPGTVDHKEAALLALRLAEFRRATGKGAALLTLGAPRFAATRSEGVQSVAVPEGARTVFGVDAFAPHGRAWLRPWSATAGPG